MIPATKPTVVPATMSAAQQPNPTPPPVGDKAAEPQPRDDARELPEHREAAPTPPEGDKKPNGDKPADNGNGNGRVSKMLEGKPESVQLLLQLMAGVVTLEFIHQVFSFILAVLNFDTLKAAAKQTVGQDSEISDTLTTAAAWGSLALTTIISLTIIGILAWMVWLVQKKSKHAGTARRMLFIFSLYFTFRLLLVFLARPVSGSNAPDWLYVIDGSLQILIGVAAILVLVFSSREETLEYTGEMEKLRQFEQEQKKLQEQRQKELKEKKASGKGAKSVQDEKDYGTFKGMMNRWRKNDKRSDKDSAAPGKDSDKSRDKRDTDKDSQ